jgi:hypothetical protein
MLTTVAALTTSKRRSHFPRWWASGSGGTARRPVLVCVVVAMSVAVTKFAEAKPTPAEKCAAAKLNAASKKIAAKLRCYQKAVAANGRLHPNCLVAADAIFAAAFARAEARGGCATTGDATAVEMEVDAEVASLVSALAPVTITTTPTTASSATTTSMTTTTVATTTTTAPACLPLGSACGACGSGSCRPDVGGANICAGGLCLGGPCTADADCGAGMVCIVFATFSGSSTTCCTNCP